MNDLFKAEPGCKIGWEGDVCLVTRANERYARAVTITGQVGRTVIVPRELNANYFVKNEPDELNRFFTAHADLVKELSKPISEEEIMATTTRQRLASPGRRIRKPRGGLAVTAATETTTPPAEGSADNGKGHKTGRTAYTRKLASETEKTVDEIHALAKAKYPNSDLTTTRKLVVSERNKRK